MLSYIVVLAISFVITFFVMPNLIDKLVAQGHFVIDRYKLNKPKIPTHGALMVVFASLLTCAFTPLLVRIINTIVSMDIYEFNELDISIILVISMFALFGVIDDLINISWTYKILIPLFFSFPLMVSFVPEYFYLPYIGKFALSTTFYSIYDYSDIFKVIIIPIYIMVVVNLVNMHSGFNGLQTGLSSILIIAIIIKCYLDSKMENMFLAYSILGGLLALLYYNKYPASIIEGNMGSSVFGSTIGAILVIKEYYVFGIFILLPHIIDFLLFIYINLRKHPFVKFGYVNEEGIIIAPNPFKMKFLLPYYFKLKEYQIVNLLLLLTSFFSIVGILLI